MAHCGESTTEVRPRSVMGAGLDLKSYFQTNHPRKLSCSCLKLLTTVGEVVWNRGTAVQVALDFLRHTFFWDSLQQVLPVLLSHEVLQWRRPAKNDTFVAFGGEWILLP